jgi:hypothetical protein
MRPATMKKRTRKSKLHLDRETVRNISGDALKVVAGGLKVASDDWNSLGCSGGA